MEQKIPLIPTFRKKIVNFERLTKISEMNVAEKTVPLESSPKISEFLPKWIAPSCVNEMECQMKQEISGGEGGLPFARKRKFSRCAVSGVPVVAFRVATLSRLGNGQK